MIADRGPRASGHLLVGLLFIVSGIIFLVIRLNLIAGLSLLSQGWPLIVIFIGVLKIFSARTGQQRIGGLFWLILGGLFFASNSGYLPYNAWNLIWPLALVWFGLFMVWRSRQVSAIPTDAASSIGSMAFLGGVNRRINSKQFRGGEITAVLGGCNLDLRDAELAGSEAVINTFIWLGGLELIVPPGWTVISKVVPVMGGLEDRTIQPPDDSKRLIIDGFMLMGGIEIKN